MRCDHSLSAKRKAFFAGKRPPKKEATTEQTHFRQLPVAHNAATEKLR